MVASGVRGWIDLLTGDDTTRALGLHDRPITTRSTFDDGRLNAG
jgi:hypothetical protein